jgi:hypothetical protein
MATSVRIVDPEVDAPAGAEEVDQERQRLALLPRERRAGQLRLRLLDGAGGHELQPGEVRRVRRLESHEPDGARPVEEPRPRAIAGGHLAVAHRAQARGGDGGGEHVGHRLAAVERRVRRLRAGDDGQVHGVVVVRVTDEHDLDGVHRRHDLGDEGLVGRRPTQELEPRGIADERGGGDRVATAREDPAPAAEIPQLDVGTAGRCHRQRVELRDGAGARSQQRGQRHRRQEQRDAAAHS